MVDAFGAYGYNGPFRRKFSEFNGLTLLQARFEELAKLVLIFFG